MNKGIVIQNPIYPKAVLVWRGENRKKMFKFFKKSYGEWKKYKNSIQHAFNQEGYEGYCIATEEGSVFIHLTDKAGTGTIVHEVFHAVEFQLSDIGVNFGEPPNEAYAYYLSFLVKEIVNNLYND